MPSLMAVLGLDASGFQEKLAQSQRVASQAGKNMASGLTLPIKQALGAFAVGALVRDAFGMAERIHDLSRQFRVSAETIQQWDIAAKRTGLSAEDLGSALFQLEKARVQAVASGDLGGFAKFAVPMEALRDATISTQQVLERMIEVAGSGTITEEQDVAGMELMGKSGAKLLAAFQELHNLGPVTLLSEEEVQRMNEAAEGFENLKRKAAELAGKGYIAAVEAPKELWRAVWPRIKEAFSRSRPQGPVFGGEGSDPFGGFTVTSTTEPDKLHGPVVIGKTKKELEELERARAALAERVFSNTLRTLSAEEKRAALNERIAAAQERAAAALAAGDELRSLEEQTKVEELRAQLLAVRDASGRGLVATADVNALQRIGAYTAGVSGMERAVLGIEKDVRRIAERGERTLELEGF